NLLAENAQRADQHTLLEHRHDNKGTESTQFENGDAPRVAIGVSASLESVEDVDRLLGASYLTKAGVWSPNARFPQKIGMCRGYPQPRERTKRTIGKFEHDAKFRIANPHRIGEHCLKD